MIETDIIIYGAELATYIAHEFHGPSTFAHKEAKTFVGWSTFWSLWKGGEFTIEAERYSRGWTYPLSGDC